MNKVFLIPGLHGYLPIGSDDALFEEHYELFYKPYLRLLNSHNRVNAVLHHSGIVLEWIEKNHPEYFSLLKELVKKKQVEMLGGGFYEPVLPLIPNNDKLGQIEKLTTYIRKHFGRRPRGSWITEMVWEPTLVYTLKSSGMEYTILNEKQILLGGLDSNSSYYPVITEDQGKLITVFPNSSDLVERAFSQTPEEIMEEIRSIARRVSNPVIMLIFNDEMPLRGSEVGWVEKFFKIALGNSDWIEFITPSVYLKMNYPLRKVYLPVTSGIDSERGAFYFRQFLSRYPDANLIYARMIHANILVNQIRGDKYKKRSAQNELWKGQCHSAYWHNRNGGIYDNSLRKEIYKSLIESEKIARTGSGFVSSILMLDFDMDGCSEYLYQSRYINAFIHSNGGMLMELDYLPAAWNYCDTVRRTPEPYHKRNIEKLGYDSYPRKCFVDHFFRENTSLESFSRMEHGELRDFTTGKYERSDLKREKKTLQLFRTGKIEIDERKRLLKLEKVYIFKRREVTVTYRLFNLSEAKMHFTFAVEFNIALPPEDSSEIILKTVDESAERLGYGDVAEREGIVLAEGMDYRNGVVISLSANMPARLWMFPLETFSLKRGVVERSYQATTILYGWDINLEPMSKDIHRISLRLSDMKQS